MNVQTQIYVDSYTGCAGDISLPADVVDDRVDLGGQDRAKCTRACIPHDSTDEFRARTDNTYPHSSDWQKFIIFVQKQYSGKAKIQIHF